MYDIHMLSINNILRLAFFTSIAVSCLFIIYPFAPSFIWALIISISLWPIYERYEGRLGGQRFAMGISIMLLIFLVAPIVLVGFNVVSLVPQAIAWMKTLTITVPPEWLTSSVFWTHDVAKMWEMVRKDISNLQNLLLPYLQVATPTLFSMSKSLFMGAFHMTLAILLSAFILPKGRFLWKVGKDISEKLFPSLHFDLMEIIAQTVKGITIGVVGTSFAQMLALFITFMIVGQSGALILSFFTFILAIAQIPTMLVWGPVAIYFLSNHMIWQGVLIIFIGVVVMNIVLDGILKPVLISKEAKMPMFLVFLGVIGGLIAWGLMGIFLGPVVLSLTYVVTKSWLSKIDD